MQVLPDVEAVRRVVERGLLAAPEQGLDRTLLLVNRGFLLSQREGRRDDAAESAVREAAVAAEELGDADLLSGALDLVATHEENLGRYGDAYRTDLRRTGLVARMTDVKEIGDALSVAARAAHHLGRFREAEAHASACIERARGIDSGSYLHGLTWRVAARFALGDWTDALADQAELERVAALSPRELPPAYAMGAYNRAALCHELRGEREEADRYIELAFAYVERVLHARAGGSIHLPPFALVLARRGRFDEALGLIPLAPTTLSAGATLEALCEITAARERWDEAAELVRAAREEAAVGEQLSLPLFADRLEGRRAAAAGDAARATRLLGRSTEGFAALGARWEEAWSRLLLAEALADRDAQRAERELAAALSALVELGSLREAERARTLLASVTV
jgi:tetratricopeptide (TPR) repeat protein